MKKRSLIFSLAVSSMFIPSIESVTINDSLENENNSFEAHEIPIAEGGGGGGIRTFDEIESDCKATSKRAIQFFERKLSELKPEGQSNEQFKLKKEEYKNKINEYKEVFRYCDKKNKRFEKENAKQLTGKEAAIQFVDNRINEEIKKERNKASNIDSGANFQAWSDQLIESNDKIIALEKLRIEIKNFLKYAFSKYEELVTNGEFGFKEQMALAINLKTKYSDIDKVKVLAQKAIKLGLTDNKEINDLIKDIASAFYMYSNFEAGPTF